MRDSITQDKVSPQPAISCSLYASPMQIFSFAESVGYSLHPHIQDLRNMAPRILWISISFVLNHVLYFLSIFAMEVFLLRFLFCSFRGGLLLLQPSQEFPIKGHWGRNHSNWGWLFRRFPLTVMQGSGKIFGRGLFVLFFYLTERAIGLIPDSEPATVVIGSIVICFRIFATARHDIFLRLRVIVGGEVAGHIVLIGLLSYFLLVWFIVVIFIALSDFIGDYFFGEAFLNPLASLVEILFMDIFIIGIVVW